MAFDPAVADIIERVLDKLDTNHDLAQNRQSAQLRPTSRLATAIVMLQDTLNDINSTTKMKTNARQALKDIANDDLDPQAALNAGVDIMTQGNVTAITGPSGMSYENGIKARLFEPDMLVTVQQLMRDSEKWSSLSKNNRTASPHVWLTGYRNQDAKTSDGTKIIDDYYKDINTASIPIGTQPLVANKRISWGSVNITWDDTDAAAIKSNGQPYYSFDVYNGSNLLRIANFMITFMYPETPVERGGLVIDGGGAGCLRAISALPQITAIICPAVVGDSAPLCPHNIGGRGNARNSYSFADALTKDEFLEKSNISSNGFQDYVTRFYYQRDSAITGIYHEKTYSTFNYVIEVTGNDINVKGEFPFTQNGPSMGPSVPYIAALIHAARSNASGGYNAIISALSAVTPKGSVLSLGSFPVDLFTALQGSGQDMNIALQLFERICFDIKRCGDWEQVESVPAVAKQKPEIGITMLGTGDILCMAQARLQGLCGAWHNEKPIGNKGYKATDDEQQENDADDEDNSFGSGGNPESWNIIAFRNPQNVDENAIALFQIRDIVGKLHKPLQIIYNNSLGTTLDKLTLLHDKCKLGVGLLCNTDFNHPANALSAINLSNVAQKCQLYIPMLQQITIPDIDVMLAACRDFSSDFNSDLTNPDQSAVLETVLDKYRILLNPTVKSYADILNPFIEVISTTLYSIGCSYDSVTILCEEATPISLDELDRIFGLDDTQPVNPDRSINTDFVIDDAFGYFAEWHTNILKGRTDIFNILQLALPTVDDTDPSSVADFVKHFNTNILEPLKTIMSSKNEYSIAISRIVAASNQALIKDVNKNYKLKSIANFPVPSRVSGSRRAATSHQLRDFVKKVRETYTILTTWFDEGNTYSTVLCGMFKSDTTSSPISEGSANKIMHGGILSNDNPDDYSDAIQNYFDILIQEVMGYLKLCENSDPGSAQQLEGFTKARNAFCNGTARDVDGQLTFGPKLPSDPVILSLLNPYYDDSTRNVMSFFRILFLCQGGQATQENINRCIELRKALEALWSYDTETIRRNAEEWIALNDLDITNPHAISFINRAIYSVIDPNTNIPRAFYKSEWQRAIFGCNEIIGRTAGYGGFGLLSPYWPGVFQAMADYNGDPASSYASTADLVESIENDMGLYADNYSLPVELAINEYITGFLPMINEIDFTLPVEDTPPIQATNLYDAQQLDDGAGPGIDPGPGTDPAPGTDPIPAEDIEYSGFTQSQDDPVFQQALFESYQDQQPPAKRQAISTIDQSTSAVPATYNWFNSDLAPGLSNLFDQSQPLQQPIQEPWQSTTNPLKRRRDEMVSAYGGRKKKITKKRNKKKKMTKKKSNGKKSNGKKSNGKKSNGKKKMTQQRNKKKKKTRVRVKGKLKKATCKKSSGSGDDIIVSFSKLNV
jgi:hypothetical protein